MSCEIILFSQFDLEVKGGSASVSSNPVPTKFDFPATFGSKGVIAMIEVCNCRQQLSFAPHPRHDHEKAPTHDADTSCTFEPIVLVSKPNSKLGV